MRRPAIATHLPLVERTFPNGAIATYEPADPDDFARMILRLLDEPEGRERSVDRAAAIVADLSWERDSLPYLALLDRFARDR